MGKTRDRAAIPAASRAAAHRDCVQTGQRRTNDTALPSAGRTGDGAAHLRDQVDEGGDRVALSGNGQAPGHCTTSLADELPEEEEAEVEEAEEQATAQEEEQAEEKAEEEEGIPVRLRTCGGADLRS